MHISSVLSCVFDWDYEQSSMQAINMHSFEKKTTKSYLTGSSFPTNNFLASGSEWI
jgi:hypothetical protein